MDPKSFLSSKTLWTNVIAIGATFLASKFGFTLDAADQVTALGVVNIILRIITKQPITFA